MKVTELTDLCLYNQKTAARFLEHHRNLKKEQESEIAELKAKIEALEAQIEEKKIYEEIQNEREIRKSKEKEIIQLLGIQSSSAPKRNRRPIGCLES